MTKSTNHFRFDLAASSASVCFLTILYASCQRGDYSLVPTVFCFIKLFRLIVSTYVPVISFITCPLIRGCMTKSTNHFRFDLAASSASICFFTILCTSCWRGDYSFVPAVFCFIKLFRLIVLTCMPMIVYVTAPLIRRIMFQGRNHSA